MSKSTELPHVQRAFSGAAGGVVATVVVSPLDVTKTRTQLASGGDGVYSAVRAIVRREGVPGLYRGLSAALATVPTFYFAFFPTYEVAKSRCSEFGLGVVSGNVASAVCAGVVADTVTNPLWVVRTRMQTRHFHRGAGAASIGLLQTGREIFAKEGARAFYKGYTATLLGLSHVAIQLPLYESLKSRRLGGGGSLLADVFIASALSKMVATSLTYPHEVIRTRLQDQRDQMKYRGLFHGGKVIWREEGLAGLFSGLRIGLVRVVPTTVVTFAVYEGLVDAFARANGGGGVRTREP